MRVVYSDRFQMEAALVELSDLGCAPEEVLDWLASHQLVRDARDHPNIFEPDLGECLIAIIPGRPDEQYSLAAFLKSIQSLRSDVCDPS